jgi:hypothetical protein
MKEIHPFQDASEGEDEQTACVLQLPKQPSSDRDIEKFSFPVKISRENCFLQGYFFQSAARASK